MAADVLNFTDSIVATLMAQLADAGIDAIVSREYEVQFDLGKFTGLNITVFPVSYVRDSPATRLEDNLDTECVVVVCERYDQPGKPPKDWLDAHVNMVDQCIFEPLRKITQPLRLDEFWLQSVEVTTVFDLQMLRQNKVFWSEIEVVFRKLRQ